MKAWQARLLEPRKLVFEEVECRSPGPQELLGRTLVSAVSAGTELAAYEGAQPLHSGPAYPRLVGYCNVARVEMLGADVADYAIGDLILTHQSHRTAFTCSTAEILLKLPAGSSPREVAFLYLAQLAYAALRRAGGRTGETLLVQGLGFLGLSAVMLGRTEGMKTIAIGNTPTRVELARKLGAHQVADTTDALDGVADVIVSTVNGWDALRAAMKAARPHARISLLGFPGRGAPPPRENPLDPVLFYRKQLSLLSAGYASSEHWGGGDVEAALRDNLRHLLTLVQSGEFALAELISHEFPARNLGDLYERLSSRDRSVTGALLTWDGFGEGS